MVSGEHKINKLILNYFVPPVENDLGLTDDYCWKSYNFEGFLYPIKLFWQITKEHMFGKFSRKEINRFLSQ